jgi:cytoskeletal protein RodZ
MNGRKNKNNEMKNSIKPKVSSNDISGKKEGLSSITNPGRNNNEIMETLGSYLQDARVKAGHSLNQVAMTTKIHIHYLEAIERDDFKNTPPFIYVKAYIKKLCELYRIDVGKTLNLLKNFDKSNTHISNTILQDLKETKQTNKKEEEKIMLYVKLIGGVIAILVLAVIVFAGIKWLNGSSNSLVDKPLTVVQKTELKANMEKLVAPQFISMSELRNPK